VAARRAVSEYLFTNDGSEYSTAAAVDRPRNVVGVHANYNTTTISLHTSPNSSIILKLCLTVLKTTTNGIKIFRRQILQANELQ